MPSRVAIAAIRRVGAGPARTDQDLVAVEAPLAIVVRSAAGGASRPLGIVMRTPGDDRELVLGLLYSEGLIRTKDDVVSCAVADPAETGETADVTLAASVDLDARFTGRALAGTSACGLCGRLAVEHVNALRRGPARPDLTWSAELVSALPAALRAAQTVFAETGGLHAAGLFDRDGRLLGIREDVGRHNAVDKLVGAALDAAALPAVESLVVVSGRVAYEIVQKAVMAGVAGVVAVGAPSSLAVDAARATGLILIGFARDGRFNVYAEHDRVLPASPGAPHPAAS
ncbi:MAG TPA: formate dehydrogenase accessory sulfurtransferase FdhD [Vicinamibacterales bacterium]|nr:formate dehydrogenase accessory sulfurtransferase FdhD [Vicinamibacterales bacterium]